MEDKAFCDSNVVIKELTGEDIVVENDGTFEIETKSIIPRIALQRRDDVYLTENMLKNMSSEHQKEEQSNVGEDANPLNRSDGNLANPLLKKDTNDDKRRLDEVNMETVGDDNADDDGVDKTLPIDRGWAWMILLASLLVHFIVIGQLKCFGIVFVQFQRRFSSSSTETSVIMTVNNAAYSITALLSMTIGSNIPTRRALVIGTTLACIGPILTGFIYDVRVAYITVGAVTGVANAFIMPLMSTEVSSFFVKRRGFANNAMNIGCNLGGIALAPLFTKCFEYYGYTGALILITGLNLQILVMTCLMRPLSFYRGKKTKAEKSKDSIVDAEEEQKLLDKDYSTDDTLLAKEMHSGVYDTKTKYSKESSVSSNLQRQIFLSEGSLMRTDKYTRQKLKPHSNAVRFASTDLLHSSSLDLTLFKQSGDEENKRQKSELVDGTPNTCYLASRRMLAKLIDTKLLSNPVFQYYLVVNALLCAGASMTFSYLPTHAIELGISADMAAMLISIPNILGIPSKFIFGFLSDKGWCHRSTLIAITCFILGMVAQCVHFMTSFGTLLIYALMGELLQGAYFTLHVVVIIDILGMENLKGALGFISLVQGITSGVCMPIAGYLRDYSGSYTYTFTFIGSLLLSGASLCYFVPNVHTWHLNKLKQKQAVEEK
ncbi:hypothetical protein ACF0H5_020707 [Mactra antiquata]